MTQNSRLFLAVFFLLLVYIRPASAQFVELQLKIDSKLAAQNEQTLSFDILEANIGKETTGLGDVDMGIFSINALERQVLLISLDKPKALFHQDPAIADKIPISLSARYGYSIQNYGHSFLLKSSPIKVKKDSSEGPWNTIYIFMFGSITIGDITNGVYANDLTLTVEYL